MLESPIGPRRASWRRCPTPGVLQRRCRRAAAASFGAEAGALTETEPAFHKLEAPRDRCRRRLRLCRRCGVGMRFNAVWAFRGLKLAKHRESRSKDLSHLQALRAGPHGDLGQRRRFSSQPVCRDETVAVQAECTLRCRGRGRSPLPGRP